MSEVTTQHGVPRECQRYDFSCAVVRVHDARHTAATHLLAQGVDQRVVMEILGHCRSA